MIYIFVVVLVLVAAALAAAVFPIADAVRHNREARTRLVKRRLNDRRRQRLAVAVERRVAPRRQDDIARRFLREVEHASQAAAGRQRASTRPS